MSKPAKSRRSSCLVQRDYRYALAATAAAPKSNKSRFGLKAARVIAMLQSPAGTTIAAMMKATGWQQHSVRGFLAGVVRKRLKLKLGSEKIDGNRVYQIAGAESTKPSRSRKSSTRQSS